MKYFWTNYTVAFRSLQLLSGHFQLEFVHLPFPKNNQCIWVGLYSALSLFTQILYRGWVCLPLSLYFHINVYICNSACDFAHASILLFVPQMQFSLSGQLKFYMDSGPPSHSHSRTFTWSCFQEGSLSFFHFVFVSAYSLISRWISNFCAPILGKGCICKNVPFWNVITPNKAKCTLSRKLKANLNCKVDWIFPLIYTECSESECSNWCWHLWHLRDCGVLIQNLKWMSLQVSAMRIV